MFAPISRSLSTVAQMPPVRRIVTESPATRGLVSRFVAGNTIDDAVKLALSLQTEGIHTALDLLGEDVATAEEARRSTDEYLQVIAQAHAAGVGSIYLSVKLTALGLTLSREEASRNL
jgi:proline dehydrogenase